jgi:hypothetical protein
MCANAGGSEHGAVEAVVPVDAGDKHAAGGGEAIVARDVIKPACSRRKRKNLALPVTVEKRVHFSDKVSIIEGTASGTYIGQWRHVNFVCTCARNIVVLFFGRNKFFKW